mmetsp:Transcript_38799/g.116653  ORF Transcript_38799/g.116653 Transcript_38799/m.116653 type:complete len:312 (+) Transcript_38799:1307-2242(+)
MGPSSVRYDDSALEPASSEEPPSVGLAPAAGSNPLRLFIAGENMLSHRSNTSSASFFSSSSSPSTPPPLLPLKPRILQLSRPAVEEVDMDDDADESDDDEDSLSPFRFFLRLRTKWCDSGRLVSSLVISAWPYSASICRHRTDAMKRTAYGIFLSSRGPTSLLAQKGGAKSAGPDVVKEREFISRNRESSGVPPPSPPIDSDRDGGAALPSSDVRFRRSLPGDGALFRSMDEGVDGTLPSEPWSDPAPAPKPGRGAISPDDGLFRNEPFQVEAMSKPLPSVRSDRTDLCRFVECVDADPASWSEKDDRKEE